MKENIVGVLDTWFNRRLEAIHTILPGIIQEYDPATRLATVKALVTMRLSTSDEVAVPPIANVPVMFPSSKNFSLCFPLQRGDGVLILFSEAGIGNFIASPGTSEVAADDQSRFSLTDAVCIPGLWSSQSVPLKTPPADGVVLNYMGKEIVVTEDEITLDGGSLGVARKDDPVQVTLSHANLLAIAASLVCTSPGNPPTVSPGALPIPVTDGKITGASTTVKAGG